MYHFFTYKNIMEQIFFHSKQACGNANLTVTKADVYF